MPADPDPANDTEPSATDDAFVSTLHWLRQQLGVDGTPISVADLAARSGINDRTLRNWLRGDYPRQRTSTTVLDLYLKETRTVSSYPPDTGPLTSLAGAPKTNQPKDDQPDSNRPAKGARALADDATAVNALDSEAGADATTGPRQTKLTPRRAWSAAAVAIGIAAVVVVSGFVAGWWSHPTRIGHASAIPDTPSPSGARGLGGDTPTVTETAANHLGSPVYKDPEGSTVGGAVPARIPFGTIVQVICHAPNDTGQGSVTALYLLRGGTWDGLYAVSDTFTNGDPLGSAGPTNLDPHIPACP